MRKLWHLVVALALSGCVTYGRDFGTVAVRNIQTNVTTQKEIFGLFGEPVRKGLDSGYETWTYSYHSYQLGQLMDSKELYVVYNKDGTVRSYSFTSK